MSSRQNSIVVSGAREHNLKDVTVELEQSFLGRLLGYGTVVAGDLEIACVPRPREVCGLVEKLAG
jgi:hypothetical protein